MHKMRLNFNRSRKVLARKRR